MIRLALLLFAGAAAEPSAAAAPDLLAYEAASDDFARCFEPRLARDPVILRPPGDRIALVDLDNEVSGAAFAACLPLLEKGGARLKESGHAEGRRWLGLRLMAQRYAFYQSRGAIGLAERLAMRPFFSCVESRLEAGGASAAATNELRAEAASAACAVHRYKPAGEGPLVAVAAAVADRYQDRFAGDAARFQFNPDGTPADPERP